MQIQSNFWDSNTYVHTKGSHWLANLDQRSIGKVGKDSVLNELRANVYKQEQREKERLSQMLGTSVYSIDDGVEDLRNKYFTTENDIVQIFKDVKTMAYTTPDALRKHLTYNITGKNAETRKKKFSKAIIGTERFDGLFLNKASELTEIDDSILDEHEKVYPKFRKFLNQLAAAARPYGAGEEISGVDNLVEMYSKTFKNIFTSQLGLAWEEVFGAAVQKVTDNVKIHFTGQDKVEYVGGKNIAKADLVLEFPTISVSINMKSASEGVMRGKGISLQDGTIEGLARTIDDEKERADFLWVLVNYYKLSSLSNGFLAGEEARNLLNTSELPILREIKSLMALVGIGHSFLSDEFYAGKSPEFKVNNEARVTSDFLVLGETIYSKSQVINSLLNNQGFESYFQIPKNASFSSARSYAFDKVKNVAMREIKSEMFANKETITNPKLMERAHDLIGGEAVFNEISKSYIKLKLKYRI